MRTFCGFLMTSLLAMFFFGCEKPDAALAPVNSGTSGVASTNSTVPGTDTSPGNDGQSPTQPGTESGGPDDNPATKGLTDFIKNTKPDDAALKIDPNSDKWEGSTPAEAPDAENLGSKIDNGIANLPATFAEISMECVDRGAILRSSPKAKIQDKNHFSIEYTFPEDQGATNSITADGSERAMFESGKLKKLAPLGKEETRVKLSRAEIEEFARRMPADGFRYFSHGDRPWSALVAGLQDPKNGFNVKVTEMDANPIGEKRPFYRLIAQSKKGNKLDIEIVVDSKRNVPVVFRATQKYADGQDRRLVWKAEWKFGGNFEKNEFKIPVINVSSK
ncbi:MAG: hypothetical protein ACKVQS_09385 [Fimbriimonadaceae bacterium]